MKLGVSVRRINAFEDDASDIEKVFPLYGAISLTPLEAAIIDNVIFPVSAIKDP